MTAALKLACALALVTLLSCSFVQFERGPHAIRDLEVVYSAQEDLTFFSWRLRKDAQPGRVHFELVQDGAWLVLELEEAPFPAEPYECGEFWCFQYQLAGEYELPTAFDSPLRSVHVDEGMYMGPAERSRRVQRTFMVKPIAIGRNDGIVPNRFDWFAENDVPLRRDYEWQFTRWEGSECADPGESWSPMTDPVEVDRQWTDLAVANSGICFAARPARHDADGAVFSVRMGPSAETTWEIQDYTPPKLSSPIVWGVVLDLEIPSESRCRSVKNAMLQMLESAIKARGVSRKLGVYTPLDSETGAELGGCDQAAVRDYPFEQMLQDAEAIKNEYAPTDVRVLWIFVNNIELPPPDRVLEQLAILGLLAGAGGEIGGIPIPDEFREEVPEEELPDEFAGDLPELYTWAIGSNVFMSLVPWNLTTGWRPVEDETFFADIRSVTKSTLPFATMLHDASTEVAIRVPPEAPARPQQFKICIATPQPVSAVGANPGRPWFNQGDIVDWPQFDDATPFYSVEFEPQFLVEASAYVRRRLSVVVEVCTAFCSGPFRTRGGVDHPVWAETSICQWQQ